MNDTTAVRIDKWLWAARFYKTRALAKNAVDNGRVHYNGQKIKPGRTVELGATIKLRAGYDDKVIIVDGLSDRRGPASEAQTLYHETDESVAKREQAALLRKQAWNGQIAPDHRPNKKERREISRLKAGWSEDTTLE